MLLRLVTATFLASTVAIAAHAQPAAQKRTSPADPVIAQISEATAKDYDTLTNQWGAELKAGKISELTYSKRMEAIAERFLASDHRYQAYLKYRVFIASELEKKKISKEEFDYKRAEKWAEYQEAKARDQREAAAQSRVQTPQTIVVQPQPREDSGLATYMLLQGVANSMQRAYRPPVNCTSTAFGNTVNTNCF